MNRPAVDRERGLFHGLAHRWMGMTGPRDILCRCTELHGQHCLSQQIAGQRPKNMHAEHTVRLRIRKDFDHAVCIGVGARAAIGCKWKFADTVVGGRFLEVFFGLSNAGDLGPSVDDSRNELIVDVTRLPSHYFNADHALILRLMRQHRARHAVADRKNTLDVGLKGAVDLNDASVVALDSDLLEAQTLGIRMSTDRKQDDIALDILFLTTVNRFNGQRYARLRLLR